MRRAIATLASLASLAAAGCADNGMRSNAAVAGGSPGPMEVESPSVFVPPPPASVRAAPVATAAPAAPAAAVLAAPPAIAAVPPPASRTAAVPIASASVPAPGEEERNADQSIAGFGGY